MCGIAGCLHREGAPPEVLPLARMLGALRHRGPEENGAALDDRCALGLARLALNDLDGGMQPLRTEDDQVWLVANGEIFNHRELRRQLEARGHRFRTRSDCEVVLHLYEERGLELAQPLNGDFAIALWDRRRSRLLLLRDRFGVRPLFWAEHEGRLLFGSEVKALLAAGLPAELDVAGLLETLTQWAPLPPRTVFAGVRSVPPGSLLVADPDGIFLHRYWEPTYPAAGLPPLGRLELARATEELEAVLDDATRLRLAADVPVGAYLSGGLDSSLLCALAMRQGADPDTFSISFTEDRFDESEHQRLVAEHLGTRHHVVHCGPDDIAAALPQVVRHAETVLLRTAPAPLLLLSGLVHEHGLKAVLTGEGADEFAVGYDLF
ncbi:MAG: asparagine synthase (glutamine-hydrolyzing), partial [Candidatus Dormibacteraceae bacterium]